MNVCRNPGTEQCAFDWHYANFAEQECEGRVQWNWEQNNMTPDQPFWWEEDISMTELATGLGIHKAICSIKLALASGGGIGKDRTAPAGAGGFRFRGIEDFDNILCGLTAEHNIAGPYPRIVSKEIVHGSTAKGGYQCHVFLEVEWTYVCSIDGSKHVTSTMGEAMDTQDKACNKAMQAARKYADVMVFRIPVGGDDTESVYVPDVAQQQGTPAQQPAAEPARRTRGPNKPKEEPVPIAAEITHPAEVLNGSAPFPITAAQPVQPAVVTEANSLLSRILSVNTFPLLYAIAQDVDSNTSGPANTTLKDAVKKRAIHLFSVAPNMSGVQEGFELVTALGQPDDLKQAANAAYGKFRK